MPFILESDNVNDLDMLSHKIKEEYPCGFLNGNKEDTGVYKVFQKLLKDNKNVK